MFHVKHFEGLTLMKFKQLFKSLFFLNIASFTGLHFINRYISDESANMHFLSTEKGSFYKWKSDKVFYFKKGSGPVPVLLLHDARSYSCADEWDKVSECFPSDKYTVYCPDLPGCGRSDKPGIKYTNYYYVQFISSFIRDIVGKPVVAAAGGISSSFLFMTALNSPDLISSITAINPLQFKQLERIPDGHTRFICNLINMPVIGTNIYYYLSSKRNLLRLLARKLIYDPLKVSAGTLNMFYCASHLGGGSGKYLMSSIDGHYLYWNIKRFLPRIKIPVTIVCGEKQAHGRELINSYRKMNPSFKGFSVSGTKLLSHMENPEHVARIISKAF